MSTTQLAYGPVSSDGTLFNSTIADTYGMSSFDFVASWATVTGTPTTALTAISVWTNATNSTSGATLLQTLETALDYSTGTEKQYTVDLKTAQRYNFVKHQTTYVLGTTPKNLVTGTFILPDAGIIDGFTTLANLKAELGITDTVQDALFIQLINSVSNQVSVYLGRTLKRSTYTSEVYAINGMNYLYLRNWPIIGTPSVVQTGYTNTYNTDWFMTPEDASIGRLYKPQTWFGTYLTRGTFPDSYAGNRDIAVTYTAGYYLPADSSYVAGASTSLPLELQYAVNAEIITRYRMIGSEGLQSLGQGGLSYSWFDANMMAGSSGGLNPKTVAMLAPFKRWAFA